MESAFTSYKSRRSCVVLQKGDKTRILCFLAVCSFVLPLYMRAQASQYLFRYILIINDNNIHIPPTHACFQDDYHLQKDAIVALLPLDHVSILRFIASDIHSSHFRLYQTGPISIISLEWYHRISYGSTSKVPHRNYKNQRW